jgi:hypothetical protein
MLAQQATPSDAAQSPLAASADTASGSEPAPLTTPIVVPTPLPPPTPLPTFEAQTFADDPPAERFAAAIPFDTSWSSDAARQQALGWSLEAEPSAVSVVTQPFERGLMLWRSDTGQIYALWEQEGERAWRAFEDTFEEGEAETDPALTAPGGLQQPERGFGKLWRQNPTLRDALGWAQVRENKGEALIQAFEHGLMLYVDGRIYAIGQTPAGAPVWFLE